jgi:hypothetical protein
LVRFASAHRKWLLLANGCNERGTALFTWQGVTYFLPRKASAGLF